MYVHAGMTSSPRKVIFSARQSTVGITVDRQSLTPICRGAFFICYVAAGVKLATLSADPVDSHNRWLKDVVVSHSAALTVSED
jgi:hypothetical protein